MKILTSNPIQQSLYIDHAGERLHLRHICEEGGERGPAVLMVHGIMANGRTFYSEKGKGLGPWLARHGFDVYVLDLRGRGLSSPSTHRHSQHGQTESIREDIPAALEFILHRRGQGTALHCIAHSWGGVLTTAALARRPDLARQIQSSVYLGSKRDVRVRNLNRLLQIDLFWNRAATLLTWAYGYFPAARLGIGADSESRKSLAQSQRWVKEWAWIDSEDGFDYAAALAPGVLPPTLYLAGANDPARGHRYDMRRLITQSGPHQAQLQVLGRKQGFSHDYGHLDMLVGELAQTEVYPLILQGLRKVVNLLETKKP